jgi:hypothetical protein
MADRSRGSLRPFRPQREDARLVGVCGMQLEAILLESAGVREVYVVAGTVEHYRQKHGADMDMARAEAMLPSLFEDPFMVSRGKRGELMFVAEYDRGYHLVVPVKWLPGEMWVSSLFKDNKPRVERKWGSPPRLLYRRGG